MDAATIEETNRIRVSLGMKPLPVPGADTSAAADDSQDSSNEEDPSSTLEGRQAQAYDNYKKVQEAEAAKKRREEKAAAIKKARENAQRFAVLDGKGLGEADDGGDLDAKAWLLGQKKRQKKIDKARKLEEELAAAEAAAAAAVQYTSKDLAGLKVAHDTSAFLDGDEQILTLKDTTIGENEEEGDELENLALREQEGLADRLELKKKMRGYNPNEDEDGNGGILAQYDDEIYGKQKKKFTLDADGVIAELADILGEPAQKHPKQNVSLDDIVEAGPLSSDYLDPSKIKVKKPKKSKKNTRKKQVDEDDLLPPEEPAATDSMDIDTSGLAGSKKRKTMGDDSLVDDEDLQASLAIQRKNALKKRKKMRPEDIVQQLKEVEEEEKKEEKPAGELEIGAVSMFVSGLSKPEEEKERKPQRSKSLAKTPALDEDEVMEDAGHGDQEDKPEPALHEEAPAVEDEKLVGDGMGAALALLRERGLVEASEGDKHYDSVKSRQEFLAQKRALEDDLDEETRQQRERVRMSGRLDRMSVREREEWARQQNTWRDQQQSRKMAELFSEGYKPNVELKYTDEHGRQLNQKEAFKHLSHQFHGKGSGKGKTEKRLKRIDDEKRREARSLFDANQNAGMNLAAQQQLKKRKEAGVRLG
ncbi:SART-1 protein [Stachybotrys elegans]|uniref:SART-1 protein n=1 Tax=Stachybotrys elegans TaxID=80388 RepID=A0A8K0WS67_9HYPO|nr:SART-1 protein [Stachybotrys elegans]